jgi:MFS family permease
MYAIVFATPFFVIFGALSDRIGRKWIMLAGMLLAILSYRFIYSNMYEAGSIKNKTEMIDKKTIVTAFTATTTTQFFTDGSRAIETLKENEEGKKIVSLVVTLDKTSFWKLVGWVFIQIFFVTMVYGPIAAFLVEMFPTKIRYTSMSLPYHIGNGIFGGLLPAIALFLTTKATQANELAMKAGKKLPFDKPYLEGLWYPIILAGICFIIGALYIDGNDNRIDD